jgi:hypothetical protein
VLENNLTLLEFETKCEWLNEIAETFCSTQRKSHSQFLIVLLSAQLLKCWHDNKIVTIPRNVFVLPNSIPWNWTTCSWYKFEDLPKKSVSFYLFSELHILQQLNIIIEQSMLCPGIESRWGEFLRTCPDRPWGLPSLLYNGYRIFLPG